MWATQVVVIKLIGDRLGPITIAFVPMLLSTLLFFPALCYEKKKGGVRFHWRWADAKHFILAGIFGSLVGQLTYTLGAQRTLAANAGIIMLTLPVLVALGASLVLKETLNVVRVFSFVLALVGVVLTSFSDFQGAHLGLNKYLTGNLLFLAGCAASAFLNTYCKLLVEKKYTELEILVYISVVASLGSIPLFIWVEPLHLSTFLNADRVAILGILELGLVVYGLSMLLFFRVLSRMDVTQAILGNYLLPFFIGLLGVLVLKESISPVMVIGGLTILASTLVVTVYEKEVLSLFRQSRKP
jgi:drug/metabolite transporter (DMT)-like permease